jgi:hypothetical protein
MRGRENIQHSTFNIQLRRLRRVSEGSSTRCYRSADFPVCCIAGFQTCRPFESRDPADLEVGDTAGLETCATDRRNRSTGSGAWMSPPIEVHPLSVECSMLNVECFFQP